MSFNEKHIEQFRAYLENELSTEDRSALEKQLSDDAEFKEAFEAFMAFEQALRDSEIVENYDQVGEWEANFQASKRKKTMRRLWGPIAGVAAAAAIVVFMLVPGEASNSELVSDYFEPYANVVTVRGKKESLDQALSAYDNGKYQEALELFEQYPEDSIGMFYRAESLMALKRYEEAQEIYGVIINQNGIFKEIAEYHQALAFLGNDETAQAKSALSSISKKSHYYTQATDLLERLK